LRRIPKKRRSERATAESRSGAVRVPSPTGSTESSAGLTAPRIKKMLSGGHRVCHFAGDRRTCVRSCSAAAEPASNAGRANRWGLVRRPWRFGRPVCAGLALPSKGLNRAHDGLACRRCCQAVPQKKIKKYIYKSEARTPARLDALAVHRRCPRVFHGRSRW